MVPLEANATPAVESCSVDKTEPSVDVGEASAEPSAHESTSEQDTAPVETAFQRARRQHYNEFERLSQYRRRVEVEGSSGDSDSSDEDNRTELDRQRSSTGSAV